MRRSPTPGPTRRAVLVGAPVALLAAACTDSEQAPPRPALVDPDDALRSAAAQRERALLREHDAVLAARPGLAARVAPVRAHHVEHLEALLGPAATASPSPSAPVPPVASPLPPPADDAAALTRLVAAERAAGDAHAADCLVASRALAPVLASLSASELSHQVALS